MRNHCITCAAKFQTLEKDDETTTNQLNSTTVSIYVRIFIKTKMSVAIVFQIKIDQKLTVSYTKK